MSNIVKATKIKKNQRIKNNHLHCFQWIILPNQSWLYLFSYKTMLLHWVILYSSLPLQNLYVSFFHIISVSTFQWFTFFLIFLPQTTMSILSYLQFFHVVFWNSHRVIFLAIFNLLRVSWFSACLPVLIQILLVVINLFLHSLIQHLNTLI